MKLILSILFISFAAQATYTKPDAKSIAAHKARVEALKKSMSGRTVRLKKQKDNDAKKHKQVADSIAAANKKDADAQTNKKKK